MKGRARMILLGCSCFAFNLSEAIAERNAFNCACKGHDLRLLFMQGHDLASARRISVGTLRRSSASAV